MNLKKYTKAELISKFKMLESKNGSKTNPNSIWIKINSYFKQIWNLISTFKNLLFKLTLISLLIKIFNKYRIFLKLWKFLQTIVMSIFGISLLENFGIEHIQHLFNEIRFISANIVEYFSKTSFYNFLKELFSKKEDIPSSEPTNKNGSISSIKRKEERIIGESGKNSKISEWIKPEQSENKPEIKLEETSYKKYYIIATVVIISSLAYYYSDEIKSGGMSLYEWIISFRTNPSNPGGDNSSNTTTSGNTPVQTNFSRSEQLNSETDVELIDMVDKGKNKVLTSPSLENLNDRVEGSWVSELTTKSDNYNNYFKNQTSSSSTIEDIDANSPTSSNSSSETITPSKSDNSKVFEITPLDQIKTEWKSFLPTKILDKINFIEGNIEFKDDIEFNSLMKIYLVDLEKEKLELIEHFIPLGKDVLTNDQILSMEIVSEMLTNWINKYKIEINCN